MLKFLTLAVFLCLAPSIASAQGTKDAPNFGATAGSATNASSKASKPTTNVRPAARINIPEGQLPAGTSIQWMYRNGKLVPNIR